jgi:hypothetical protein
MPALDILTREILPICLVGCRVQSRQWTACSTESLPAGQLNQNGRRDRTACLKRRRLPVEEASCALDRMPKALKVFW